MSKYNVKKIGKNLAKIRKEKGVTQAKLCGAIDVTAQQISKIELGINSINADMLFSLAKSLKVNVADFYEGCK